MKFVADFETTTDPEDCRVWAYAIAEIANPDYFIYGNNIEDFIKFCETSKNSTFYFHNLKFDGEFIMIKLFELGFKHVTNRLDLDTKTFTTLINDKGQFYSIKIMFEKKGKKSNFITIYDSLKILPFSVKEIAKGFNLPIQKLEINYYEYREIGHKLTETEISYIRNDVFIVANALNILFQQGLDKMTQGSNALFDYKRTIGNKNFEQWFPVPDYDADIRKSYRGGFTYLNPLYKGKDTKEGIVLDVNSLYPSVMRNKPLPYGEGIYFEGQYKIDKFYNLYVQMFTCQFELKKDYIPTVQLKNNLAFIPTEYLTSSNNEEVTLCMTNIDLDLFLKHYEVFNIIYHSGWKFKSIIGLFTKYIDKWSAIKIQSKIENNKAMYLLAKLMLNALYGKFALNPLICGKIPYYNNGMIKYFKGEKETRTPIYIPVGTFITSWARYKTISTAQSVYKRFIYADTDSLHLKGKNLPSNLDISDTELGLWCHESSFIRARFLRQKSYYETTIKNYEKLNDEEKGCCYKYKNEWVKDEITVAGLPESCYKFVTWENFKEGTSYSGKLQIKHVKGGIILKNIDFTIKSA